MSDAPAPMNPVVRQILDGQLRHVLTALGAAAITHGLATQGQVNAELPQAVDYLSGVALIVWPMAWSALSKLAKARGWATLDLSGFEAIGGPAQLVNRLGSRFAIEAAFAAAPTAEIEPFSTESLAAVAVTDPAPEAPANPKENTMSLKSFFSHLIGGFLMTETQKLVSKTMEKYPNVVTGVQKMIADATASADPVETKLFKVATDAIALLPAVLQALPSVKSFAILLVQTIYADGISELETEAGAAIGKL